MKIIITGAGKGIGFHTVLHLIKDSGNEVIAISRNKENLKKLSDLSFQINPHRKLFTFPLDLQNISENILFKAINDFEMNAVDVLINNAGFLINKPFEELKDADWKKVYDVNVFAPVKLIQLLLPKFNKTGSHIVNISSMGAVQGSSKFKGLSAYTSSKAALAAISECLAVELKENNVAVNCLTLGAVQTEMLNEAFPGYKAPITSEEMAEFIAYFALNGHKFFNGKIIPVALSNP